MNPQSLPVVLVVDDEAGVRETLSRYLDRWGYRAIAAASLEAAGEVLQTTPVEALILDVRLPGAASGIDLLLRARKRVETASVPILIMTGSILTEEEERLITSQRAHLFHKPEGFATIVSFLDQLTGRDRSH
jgi:DNA-binding response OmpR family regulator